MSFSMQTPISAKFEQLIYEEKGDVATITLNRPEVVNCLSVKLSDELMAAVEKVRQSESIKVLVFRGAGGNFCAGDDLKEMLTLPEWGNSNHAFRRARFYQDMAYSVEELDKLTIAAVDGYAVGGGLELTMVCDFVIATERAKWGMPEADWGITPGWGGTTRLTRLIGRRRAKEINIIASIHPAKTAVEWNLWNRVVPNDALDAEVAALIDLLRKKNHQTMRQLKYIINKGIEADLYTAQAMEALSGAWSFELQRRGVVPDHDAAAGLEAFKNKGELGKKRRNAAREFWTKPAI